MVIDTFTNAKIPVHYVKLANQLLMAENTNFPLSIKGHTYQYGLTLISLCIGSSIHYKLWDEITFPFPNFNGAAFEV